MYALDANPITSDILTLPNGEYIVTWETGNDFGIYNIYSQRYDVSNQIVGDKIHVNAVGSIAQTQIQTAVLADGSYMVTWRGWPDGNNFDTFGIYARHFGADGSPIGTEFRVDDPQSTLGSESNPQICALSNGGFVITWKVPADASHPVPTFLGRVFDDHANPVSSEITTNTTSAIEAESAVVPLANAGFAVVFSLQDNNGGGIFCQRFDGSMNPIGSEFRVNTLEQGCLKPTAGQLSNGGFAVAYLSSDPSTGLTTRVKVFDQDGNSSASDILVGTYSSSGAFFQAPSVAGLSGGRFVVTWMEFGRDGYGAGLFGQLFDPSGNKIGNTFQINGVSPGDQISPSVSAMNDGGFVVSWTDLNIISGTNQHLFDSAIYTQRFDADGRPWSGVTLSGGGNADHINGGAGVQTIDGSGGNDILSGGAGDDVLIGGTGDDVFSFGGAGDGTDTIKDFAAGDLILVVGANFSSGITEGDGSTVGQNQIQLSSNSGVTTLRIGIDSTPGADLSIKLTGVFSASDLLSAGMNIGFNAAPTISGTSTIGNIDEDSSQVGILVSDLLSGTNYHDAFAGASGIAITEFSGGGIWQYSTDNSTWTSLPSGLSDYNATLLTASTYVRFLPGSNANGNATLAFHGWDQTSDTGSVNGTPSVVSVTTNGGTTSFSTGTHTASLTVTAVNDAPTFSVGDGIVKTAIGTSQLWAADSVVLQPDGKIVVGGYGYVLDDTNYDFILARYNNDGSLDTSFSSDGYLIADFDLSNSYLKSLNLQPDGKILAIGYAHNDPNSNDATVVLARYNSDGSIDTSFDGDGKVATNIGSRSWGFDSVIQPDGKIIVSGVSISGNDDQFTSIRYNPDGSLDSSFNSIGIVTSSSPGRSFLGRTCVLQTDGKLLVAGETYTTSVGDSTNDFALMRYNSDGSLDTSFSEDGKVITDFASTTDSAFSICVQSDGKVLVAGLTVNSTTNLDIALARYNIDGSLDTSFSDDGKVTTTLGNSSSTYGFTVITQPDGKILVEGVAINANGTGFIVVRYNSDGTLDNTFNNNGKAIIHTSLGDTPAETNGLALQYDGKIVLVGESYKLGGGDLTVLRLNPDGSLDKSFHLTNTLDGTQSYTENGTSVFLDSSVSIYDEELVGSGSYNGATITLARHGGANSDDRFAGVGNLFFSGFIGVYTASGSAYLSGQSVGSFNISYGTLTITFNSNATQAKVDEVLSSIGYNNRSDSPPSSVQIDWTFNDGNTGAQGSGGAKSVTGHSIVNITAVNDAPGGTDATITVNEDGSHVFSSSDFGFNDVDVGDSLTAIRIDALPAAGTLKLSGTDVSSGQVINVANVANLVFSPVANANGVGYASFDFSVRDQSNAFSAGVNTLSFDVSALNDAPTGSVSIVGINTSSGPSIIAINKLADVDGLGVLSYQWQSSTDSISWGNISGAIAQIYTYTSSDLGKQIRVAVSYTDGGGTLERVNSNTFSTPVPSPTPTNNIAPKLVEPIDPHAVFAGASFNFTIPASTFYDANGDALTYTASGMPDDIIFDAASRTFSGAASASASGTYTVQVSASDGIASASTSFDLNVSKQLDAGTVDKKGNEKFTGGADNDYVVAGTGNDRIDGGGGNDSLNAGAGDDKVFGGDGSDYIDGGSGNDKVDGGNGNDILDGGDGNDTITGGAGSDDLTGGSGKDKLIGGEGDDTYHISEADAKGKSIDTVSEKANQGNDTVYSSISYTLPTNVENLILTGTDDLNATGSKDANTITGNSGNNRLNGMLGNDTLDGATGADTFVFDTKIGKDKSGNFTNVDTIKNFDATTGDYLELNSMIFTALKALKGTTLAAENFATGAAVDNKDFIIYDTSTGALYYDADGSGKKAAVQFAKLDGHPTFEANYIHIA